MSVCASPGDERTVSASVPVDGDSGDGYRAAVGLALESPARRFLQGRATGATSAPGGTGTANATYTFAVLPTFFIIGAAKCGTTSLHFYLDQHPEIHMSRIKEPRFFLEERPDRWLPWRVGSRSEYEELFETDAPARGESTPTYSQHPWWPGVPERIHAVVPDAKFIYLVGDPIPATVSHYLHYAMYLGETRSLHEALAVDADDNRYICSRKYATQVEQYAKYFPQSRMLVVDQADLRADRTAVLREIFGFLNVSTDFTPNAEKLYNETTSHRQLSDRYRAAREGRAAQAFRRLPEPVRRPLRRPLQYAFSRRLTKRPGLDPGTRARLAEIYRPEADRLRRLTGRQFASWSV